jgi:hypothetical protein
LFDPSKAPLTLSVPRPDRLTSFIDPRALASARYRIGRYVGRARTWRSRFLTSVAERKAEGTADPKTADPK